ncbi:MAG: recombination regulator RecX [Pseudomonadota bacterium]|nr:recombination regulator RecX [Gammaproteobacteria bacterium]MBU1733519.1 recombination regulator RecX [Gammaproteobacteria bacterium]MBU1893155.1 recombination regulator RecX [Gammaproteobacteria bacterium]
MPGNDMTIRERALGFLSRREYSRLELKRKLAPHAEDEHEVESLLDDFATRGWLSEARFAEQIVHARRSKYGAQRIVHELKEKGVSTDAVEAILPDLRESELETARAVWAKKFGVLPQDARERAKQMRFMMSRGFNSSTIGKVLQGSGD